MKVILNDKREINVREPRVKDILAMDKIEGEAGKEVYLASILTEIPQDELMNFSFSDYLIIQESIKSFLPMKFQK